MGKIVRTNQHLEVIQRIEKWGMICYNNTTITHKHLHTSSQRKGAPHTLHTSGVSGAHPLREVHVSVYTFVCDCKVIEFVKVEVLNIHIGVIMK